MGRVVGSFWKRRAIVDRSAHPPHIAVATSDFRALTAQIADRGGNFTFGPGPGPDGILRAVIGDPTGNALEITAAPLRA